MWAALAGLGVLVGAYGTLVGAGGGFLLTPALLLLYPDESAATITSISLAVVFFNALSGSVAYARLRRIDYRTGWRFGLATIPGAVLGAVLVRYIPRGLFDPLFGALLIALSIYILAKPGQAHPELGAKPLPGYVSRSITDAGGETYTYSYDSRLGLLFSSAVGWLSSLLGIGGGIIHVPVLVTILGFPPRVATATSQLVLAVMALAGTLVHVASGEFATGHRRTAALAVGVVIGAQVGARLAVRVRGKLILRLLALALAGVGARLLWSGL